MMGQQVAAWTALTEDLSSDPNTHVRQLTIASSKGHLKPLGSTGTCIYLHISTHKHITTYTTQNHFKIKSKISFLK